MYSTKYVLRYKQFDLNYKFFLTKPYHKFLVIFHRKHPLKVRNALQ